MGTALWELGRLWLWAVAVALTVTAIVALVGRAVRLCRRSQPADDPFAALLTVLMIVIFALLAPVAVPLAALHHRLFPLRDDAGPGASR